MKRNNLLKTISTLLLFVLITVITACSHNFEEKTSKTTQIKPILGASERTIFPDFDIDNLYGIKLEAKANGSSNGFVQLAIWDNINTISAIDIEPGTYNFRLTAYQGEVSFIATRSGVTIRKDKLNTISFALVVNNWGNPDTDRGNINITVNWEAERKAISNSVTLYEVDSDGNENSWYTDSNVKVFYDNDSKNGGWYINYSKYDLPVGEYKFDFVVTDENYQKGFYSDYIIVAADCTSNQTFEINEWSDMYAVASVIYENESQHVKAEPDPNGKGIKFTISYKDTDPDYLFDINVMESRSGINWTYSIWDTDDGNYQRDPTKVLGKNGLKKIEFVYPFVKNNEPYIFNIWIGGGKIENGNFITDTNFNENVFTTANGGDATILYEDYLLKLQKSGITAGEIGASMKLNYDFTKIFDRNANLSEMRLDYRFHSGYKSEPNRNWDGVYQNFDCNLLDEIGLAEYKLLLPENDGIFVTDEAALDKLKENPVYFAKADFYFNADSVKNTYGHYKLSWETEEIPYTIAKMNKITIDKGNGSEEVYMYPTNTKITFKNPMNAEGWICEGLYDNPNFTGNPITGLSAEENTTDRTLYAKWGLIFQYHEFYDNDGLQSEYKTSMNILELDASLNETLEPLQIGDSIAITLEGKSNIDFSAPINFQLWVEDEGSWYWRGDCSITPRIKAGEPFTMCFGMEVPAPTDPNDTFTAIPPKNIRLQIAYNRRNFQDQLIISDPELSFDKDPVKYTYIFSPNDDYKEYGYFVNNTEKVLPEDLYRYNWSFAGWYDNANFTGSPITKVNANDNESKTLYAKWNIKFELADWETEQPYKAYINVKEYLPGFDKEVEVTNNRKNNSVYWLVSLTGKANRDFSGSINSEMWLEEKEFYADSYLCCNKYKEGYAKVDDIKQDIPFTVTIPIKGWYEANRGFTSSLEEVNIGFRYRTSDCDEPLIISDWNIEIIPAIEIQYHLDEDYDSLNKGDGEHNYEAFISEYYPISTQSITLRTYDEDNYWIRPGYSRRFEGWYKWDSSTNQLVGPFTTYIPTESTEFKAKWSLVFTQSEYINGFDNNTHYNYGTIIDFAAFDYWGLKNKENELGKKPILKNGDHVTVTLTGTPTANTNISDYVVGGQLRDKTQEDWITLNCFRDHSPIKLNEEIKFSYDFDVTWTSEHNYEDLSILFVYDTGAVKAHSDGVGLILSDYKIEYSIQSEKVYVTYDYGNRIETVQVYKDCWFELPNDIDYFDRNFDGWYRTDSDERKYWDCLQSNTTYKAKWQYKLAKGGYDNTWAEPGDEGYHKYYYTYQTNINCREFEVKPNVALDKNNNKWCVLVFEGESNRTISDIQLRVCGWDSEDNYWFARNWSETFTLTKDVPFKLVSLINLSEGVDIPDEIDNSDYHATLMKEGLQFEDEEPILPYLKVKLYVFDSETAANQAIANGL